MKYILVGSVVLISIFFFLRNTEVEKTDQVTVKDVSYKVIQANTEELRSTGLSGRVGLDEKTVMLFSFPAPGTYGFWMKDMLFPIDILWTNDTGDTVLHIERNVSPDTYPKAFYPPSPSKYVIEARAGEFNEVTVGDLVNIK